MTRYIFINGYFYQPPRGNPWLEEVELQDSARLYHDWNERITFECCAPNTTACILYSDRKIIDIINNYKNIIHTDPLLEAEGSLRLSYAVGHFPVPLLPDREKR